MSTKNSGRLMLVAMAKFAWIALPVLITGQVSYAQDNEKSKSDLMASRPGAFIQKDFSSIGKIGNVRVLVETINDLTNSTKICALELEYKPMENASTVSVLIDPGETDTLIRFFDFIDNTVFKSAAPPGDREFSLITRSGFEAGCYWNKGWDAYIRIDTHDSHTNVELNREDVADFESLLKQARLGMTQ